MHLSQGLIDPAASFVSIGKVHTTTTERNEGILTNCMERERGGDIEKK